MLRMELAGGATAPNPISVQLAPFQAHVSRSGAGFAYPLSPPKSSTVFMAGSQASAAPTRLVGETAG